MMSKQELWLVAFVKFRSSLFYFTYRNMISCAVVTCLSLEEFYADMRFMCLSKNMMSIHFQKVHFEKMEERCEEMSLEV
ncbi:protein FAR1-RELATED SEQUENCE 9-like [Iris pallida]|uniref:Protein FAR1-RELATED SEQUENCE 9-like n=1 Tax=Iris pallida TaxID=29817 RepID=A0AAX6HMV2_IRIPA|nr:protein FAR1-RELATED SEQUENCE 9-like [Iris pallida]